MINREKYNRMWNVLKANLADSDDSCKALLDKMLQVGKFGVEPESILPRVTKDMVKSKGFYCSSKRDKMYWNINKPNGNWIAHMIGNEADVDLFCAASKVVEEAVKLGKCIVENEDGVGRYIYAEDVTDLLKFCKEAGAKIE